MKLTRILGLVAASLLLAMPFVTADPTSGRAAGTITITPDPLCGDSSQTGFNWRSVTVSDGNADWEVYLSYSYVTTGHVPGSGAGVRYFSTDTTGGPGPEVQTGVPRCGSWLSCHADVTLSWWNGAYYEYVSSASTDCI